MEPTSRRGFLKVTAASAAVVTATAGLMSLAKRKIGWEDLNGGPDCPQGCWVERMGADDLRRYGVTLVVETPLEVMETELPDVSLERGSTRLDVPLVYPYTNYQPGTYRYTLRLTSGDVVHETGEHATFTLSDFRWFA
jgi:hypothetical protein